MSEMKTLTIDGVSYEVVDEAARSVTENTNLVQYANSILKTLGGTSIDMGGAKIATGSYTGTGTYGSSNPCSLTFDFVPKFVMVYHITPDTKGVPYSGVATDNGGILGLLTAAGMLTIGGKGTSGFNIYCQNILKSFSKTVSWYSTYGKYSQFNSDWADTGTTYAYVAIG